MVGISLCMIVKNEEDVIGRCLETVGDLVDEIIIVDTGSTDRTKEIASNYTAKIYDFKWIDDFSAARNYSFSLASCDYCMWLDADDVMTEENRELFLKLKMELTNEVDAVMMKYNTGFDEKGNVTFSYYRERIVKKSDTMNWIGAVHEVIATTGHIIYSECAISHKKLHPSDPDRNLQIFEGLIKNGIPLDPRQQFYYGRELYYHKRFDDAISVFENFLDANEGWLENKLDACKHCAYCRYGLKQNDKALLALLRSFLYDIPRAEICCDIGRHMFDRSQYHVAIYWYKQALSCKREDGRGGFVSPDDYGYTPCIQLCVCYSRIGDINEAVRYNEEAGKYKPSSEAVIKNRDYFATLNTQNE